MKEILKKWQNILKLNDWDITYIEYPTMQVAAETKMLCNDYKAIIEIQAELNPEEKELTIIHELLHLVFRDAYDIFNEECKDEFAKTYCTRQHERAIEKTAKIIYGLSR